MNQTRTPGGRIAALGLAATLIAASSIAQTIDVRSTRITMKDADLAAQTISRLQTSRPQIAEKSSTGVARFPTVILGSASYQMAGGSVAVSDADAVQPEIAAVDLLPASFNGNSLANIPENFPGDPTQAGTIDDRFLPGTVLTDSLRFTVPLTSPLVGVAGPGSSPGIAGPGFVRTQGVGPTTGVQAGGVRVIGVPSTSSGTGSLMRPR